MFPRLRPLIAILLILAAAAPACREEPAGTASGLPAFVDESACAECHAAEAQAWRGSHHDMAMQPATEETVLGNFDGVVFEDRGLRARFFRQGSRFLVETEGPDGRPGTFEVAYTFGFTPLQQYLIPFPGGRYQCLTIAWDSVRGRWFNLYPDQRFEPGDPLHWTGRYQRWNAMCADCHSTDLRKGYDPETDTYSTTWFQIDVGCQACHGPGQAHLEWARSWTQTGPPAPGSDLGLMVDFAAGDSFYQVDQCARCHSRRHRISPVHVPGRALLDDYVPETLRADLYHADGQILAEVYVYGSFLQSRMYHAGVRCSDCHDPHTAALRTPGDATCLACHNPTPPERFPGLRARRYDTSEHHHHPPESEGARCVSCHMLQRPYMVVDPRRDHSFRIPRPDLTVELGTPNACNDCHADRDASWAAEAVETWFGQERPASFAPILARARRGDEGAGAELARLAADPDRPAIVRATALEHLAGYAEGAGALLAAASDRDPLVRATAAAHLDAGPPEQAVPILVELLRDPRRAVRLNAAKTLATLGLERLPAEAAGDWRAAWDDYERAQRADMDFPGPYLNLGVVDDRAGRQAEAEAAYRAALQRDPWFLPARFNLANLLNRTGRNDEAEALLRAGLELSPEEGELHYSLGLLLNEMGRPEECAQELRQAAERMPERGRVRFNLALALLALERPAEAERELIAAARADPRDPEIAWTLADLYARRGEWALALPYAEALVRLLPDDPNARALLQRTRAELGN